MVGAYVNKRRIAPQGYVAVTKKLAHQLYEQGVAVTLCGNNVNAYHVFDGWHLGYTIRREYLCTFEARCQRVLMYLERELGTYLVFYVKEGY